MLQPACADAGGRMWFVEGVFPSDGRLLSWLLVVCCFSQVSRDSQLTIVHFLAPLGLLRAEQGNTWCLFGEKWKKISFYCSDFDSSCCDLIAAYSKVQESCSEGLCSVSFLTSQFCACQETSSIFTGRTKLGYVCVPHI